MFASNYSTVRELSKRFGDQLTWFVPSGLKSWMVSSGCQKVVELGWWQEQSVNMHGQEIKFFCVPAVHWGYRSLTDRNKVSSLHQFNVKSSVRLSVTCMHSFCERIIQQLTAVSNRKPVCDSFVEL